MPMLCRVWCATPFVIFLHWADALLTCGITTGFQKLKVICAAGRRILWSLARVTWVGRTVCWHCCGHAVTRSSNCSQSVSESRIVRRLCQLAKANDVQFLPSPDFVEDILINAYPPPSWLS